MVWQGDRIKGGREEGGEGGMIYGEQTCVIYGVSVGRWIDYRFRQPFAEKLALY